MSNNRGIPDQSRSSLPSRRQTLAGGAGLLGATLFSASAASAAESLSVQPASTSGVLSTAATTTRIRVWLQSVKCRDTEDTTGADEFYLVGFVSDGGTTKPVLTKTVSVNDNQTKPLSMNGNSLVFDANVPDDRVLKVGLVAYDKDSSSDWEKNKDVAKKIADTAGAALVATGNPYAAGAGAALPAVVRGVGAIMQLDKDDELGRYTGNFSVKGLAANRETSQTWKFKRSPVPWWSDWDYTVTFAIGKGRLPRDRF